METQPVPDSNTTTTDVNTTSQPTPTTQPTTQSADVDTINTELQDLYKTVSDKIALSVANGHFTVETLEIIIAKVVETIEEMNEARATKLTGVEKRNIAMNLLKMVINDLHDRKVISDDLYTAFNMTITYLGPLAFTAAKAAYTKLMEVYEDVEKNGCRGCFSRNFGSQKPKSRSRRR